MPSNLCPVLWQSYVPMSGKQLTTLVANLSSTYLIPSLMSCLALITHRIDALERVCCLLIAPLPVQAVPARLKVPCCSPRRFLSLGRSSFSLLSFFGWDHLICVHTYLTFREARLPIVYIRDETGFWLAARMFIIPSGSHEFCP